MEVLPYLPTSPEAAHDPPSYQRWAWTLPNHEETRRVLLAFQQNLDENPSWSPSGAYDRAAPMVGDRGPLNDVCVVTSDCAATV